MIKGIALALVMLALVGACIALIDARQESRRQFITLTLLERERDQLEVEYGKLKIQQAMLADTNRIEVEAFAKLKLTFPDPAKVQMVER